MNINAKKVLSLSLVSLLTVSCGVQAAWPSFLQFGKSETVQEVTSAENKTDKKSEERRIFPFLGNTVNNVCETVVGSAAVMSAYDRIAKRMPSKVACLQLINSMPGRSKVATTAFVAGAKFAYHNPLLTVQTHPYAVALAAATVGSYGAYKGYQWYTRTPEKLLNEVEDALSDETVLLVSETNTLDDIKKTLNNSLNKIEQALLLVSKREATDENKQRQLDVSKRITTLKEQINTAVGSDQLLVSISGSITDIIDQVRDILKEITSVSVLQQAKDAVWNHKWKTLGTLSALGLAAIVAKNPELITTASEMATTAYNAARNYDYRALYNNYCNRQALAKGVSTVGTALSGCYARTRDAVGNGWAQAVDWAKVNPRVAVAAITFPAVTTTAGTGVAIKHSCTTENAKKDQVAQAATELQGAVTDFGNMNASEDIMAAQRKINEKIDAISEIVNGCNYRWAVRIKKLINVPANFRDKNKQRNLKDMINELVVYFRSRVQRQWTWGFKQVLSCIDSIQAAVAQKSA